MNQRPDFRRNGSYGSDTSSSYSVRSGSSRFDGSAYSVWSASESDSFVWRDDPLGLHGVGGAVTRLIDDRDDSRKRFAAHILSGPFAQFRKKKPRSNSNSRPSRSTASSRSSSRSSNSSVSPGRNQYNSNNNQRFQPRHPPNPGPQYHRQEHYPQEPYPQEPFMHHGFQGPPPPPPPAAPAGFENGFIQLGGSPPPPQDDPVWGNEAGYGPGPHVYD